MCGQMEYSTSAAITDGDNEFADADDFTLEDASSSEDEHSDNGDQLFDGDVSMDDNVSHSKLVFLLFCMYGNSMAFNLSSLLLKMCKRAMVMTTTTMMDTNQMVMKTTTMMQNQTIKAAVKYAYCYYVSCTAILYCT